MPKVTINCSVHPEYKGLREPKTECIICWKIYASRLRIKMKELENDR